MKSKQHSLIRQESQIGRHYTQEDGQLNSTHYLVKTERRIKRRIYLYQYLDIIDAETDKLLGYLSDFSTEGLMFISSQLLVPHLLKAIYIRNNLAGEQVSIQAQIETLWLKPNINPQMYCIGCRFYSIDRTNRQLLEQVGRSFSFADNVKIYRESVLTHSYLI